MFTRNISLLLLLNAILLNAAPLGVRQDSGTTTLMTQSTTDTSLGEMTQICTITLSPVTDANGNPAVQEVKTCKVTMSTSTNNGSSSNSTDSSTSTDTSSSTDSSESTSTDTSGSSSSTDTSATTTTDSANSPGATGSNNGVTANGVSEIPVSATATDSGASTTTDSAAASSSTASGAVIANAVSQVAAPTTTPTADAANAQAATAAAENASTSASASAFAVPGQTIQVLPIGLGVFAGISVIALIVVGLVTYERTKYRKAFRARKLAESGANMGYGGMAQR